MQTRFVFASRQLSSRLLRSSRGLSFAVSLRPRSSIAYFAPSFSKPVRMGNAADSRSAGLNTAATTDPWAATYALSPLYNHLNSDILPEGYQQTADSQGRRYAVFQGEITKSQNDDRDYRLVRLQNGLEALLVSDPETDKAAAALCVRVGHLSDPVELQGLAHFCEHLLFMGTEKYPKENEYSEFLSSNSGSSNAFTGMDETNYHFDVHPEALDGALDRFAQFFISPLFDPSCTEREIQAVDSENKKNLQNDMWRLYQLEKSLSSKNHAYWRFGTGNLESLWTEPRKKGLDPRAELLKFHKKHYSANLCKLAIVGKGSLDQLTEMVIDRFHEAKNSNLQPPLFTGSPFTKEELQKSIYVKTVKDVRHLEMTFPFPDQDALYRSKPGNFLSHFVGHEGPGSILSVLKAKGWANSLSAGASPSATGFGFFKVHLDLTAEGLENHQAVADIIFQYLDLLKQTDPQEWAFKEVAMLSEIAFRFQEKHDPASYVTGLASSLHKPYPRQDLLSAQTTLSEFNKAEIVRALGQLQLNNCRVTVGSQTPLLGLDYNETEKWYGTQYTIQPLSAFKETTSAPELGLPEPNLFLPSNLDILSSGKNANSAKQPSLIVNEPGKQVWYKKDDRWLVPKAAWQVWIKTPAISNSIRSNVTAHLFANLIDDSLAEYSYDADLAGLSQGVHVSTKYILMSVDGYNDKLGVLQKVVAERLANFTVDPKRFELIKDQMRQNLENFRLGDPYQHALFHTTHFTSQIAFSPEEQLEQLLNISAQEVQSFVDNQLFEGAEFEVLAHGNIRAQETLAFVDSLTDQLKIKNKSSASRNAPTQSLLPPQGDFLFEADVQNPDQLNSAVDISFYVGSDADQQIRTQLALLAQLAKENCFDQLRTKEQLGYIAQSGGRAAINRCSFNVIVQSERDAQYVDSRVENWLVDFRQFIDSMSEADFAQHRQSLVNRKLEEYKNLNQETNSYSTHVASGYYDFARRQKDAEAIKRLEKQDILAFYDQKIARKAPQRSKLAIHMRSQRLNEDNVKKITDHLAAQDIVLSEELQADLQTNPVYEDLLETLRTSLGQDSNSLKELTALLDGLQHPSVASGVTKVDKAWRATLQLSGPARPVQPLKEFEKA